MAPFTFNPHALRIMLILTVPVAGSLGLTHLLAPHLLVKYFGKVAQKSPYLYSDAFMGSVFCAFATTAAIGLLSGDVGTFWPIIILQGAYKAWWLLAFAATRAPLTAHNAFYVAGWLAFIAGDVWVFASATHPATKMKSKAAIATANGGNKEM